MIGLILVGAVAGLLAGISPCILPVLPVVLVAGATQPGATQPRPAQPGAGEPGPSQPASPVAAAPRRVGLARPLAVIGGLILSFSLLILAGWEIISLLH